MHPTHSLARHEDDAVAIRKSVVREVLSATVELLRDHPYRALSRRLVAERAGLARLDVCAHFASIEALIAETCLYQLRESPLVIEFDESPRQRLVGQFHQLVMLLALEPKYGKACVRALMSDADSVRPIRAEIDAEVRRRVSAALGSGAWPELVSTMQLALLGAVVQSATNAVPLLELSAQLGELVDVLLPGRE